MRLQFSLRSALLAMTLVALCLGLYRWYVSRLEYLVERHIALIDAGRFDAAEENAEQALLLHPESRLASYMRLQVHTFRALCASETLAGTACGVDNAGGDSATVMSDGWFELTEERIARRRK